MSIDLTIKANKLVRYRDVLKKAETFLSRLLNIPKDVEVIIASSTNNDVIVGEFSFDDTIFIIGYPDHIVEFGVGFVPSTIGWEDPEQEGWWFTVTLRASHGDKVKPALALALSCALADTQNSKVVLGGKFLNLIEEDYTPDTIVNHVRVAQPQKSLSQAFDTFSALVSSRG